MKALKNSLVVICFVMITSNVMAQFGIGTTTPDSSAKLELYSTSKGFLPPRVTNVDDINSPTYGLMVYEKLNKCIRFYKGSVWSDCIDNSPLCGEDITYENQTYGTVGIGNQCWMDENLNVGTEITLSNNATDNSTIEKYCYKDSTSNCDIYGGLYQWNEMMEYVTTEGTQGICPTGWHIPSDLEWMVLEEEVESTTNVDWNIIGNRGIDVGYNLKETGVNHWLININATNSSGFTALGGGTRYLASYNYLLFQALFWSSSESDILNATLRTLNNGNAVSYRSNTFKIYGMSVRCLRD